MTKMLKRDQLTPGVKLKLRPEMHDGLPSPLTKGFPTLMLTMPIGLKEVQSGTKLEVIKGVHRKDGHLTVTLKILDGSNYVGDTFWCYLRGSADLI